MPYQVEGRLLEVCTCKVVCPCWVGEDPDGGTCDGFLMWHVERGHVDGTDVSGRTIAALGHIPGNILQGNWTVRFYVDDGASPAQRDALLNVWSGKLGGPIADFAKLIGKIESIEQVPIVFNVKGVDGNVRIGPSIEASVEAFRSPDGNPTALHDAIFSSIPGSPAYVGKASLYRVDLPGFQINLKGHSAISGSFRFTG